MNGGGGGGFDDSECGKHRSVILQECNLFQIKLCKHDVLSNFDANYSLLKTLELFMLCDSPSTVGNLAHLCRAKCPHPFLE